MSDQPGTPSPAAGWYTDPAGGGGQRYWDGAAWTEHVQAPAVPAAPEAPVAPPVAAEPQMPVAPAAPAPPASPAYPPAPAPPTPAYAAAPAYAGQQYGGQQYGGMQYAGPVARSIGFAEAIKRAFSRWTNYSDRATVAEYWWFYLFTLLVTIGVYIIVIVLGAASATTTTNANGVTTNTIGALAFVGFALLVVWGIVVFFVQLPLSVRRLHDGDRSGWWLLLGFVPFGSLVLLIFFIMGGTPGPNQYGPPVS